ncbi:MAG: TraB/GumN family protein [Candidatus Altiarchaeota archaeon]|nr:TraB/GumN family protein [Candidatus Altiarchaeota archaeon]
MGINMIRLIGTGHIFEKSVQAVEKSVDGEKPDIVAIELDGKRFAALEARGWRLDLPEETSIVSLLKDAVRGGSLPVLLEGFLAMIQRDLGRQFGVHAGSDMLAAIHSARKIGCKIALIDRDINITLNHVLSIPLKEKLRLFSRGGKEMEMLGSLLGTNIEDILEEKNIEKILHELRQTLPMLYSALVDERDMYMAQALLKLMGCFPEANIVAVVGAGHLKGIDHYLRNPEGIKMEKLSELRPVSKIQLLPLLISLIFVYIFMKIKFRFRR